VTRKNRQAPRSSCCLTSAFVWALAGSAFLPSYLAADQSSSQPSAEEQPQTSSDAAVETWPAVGQRSDSDGEPGMLIRAIEELELSEAWRWLEDRRDGVSRNVNSVGRNIDDWLAGEAVGERANQSYLRVGFNQRVGRFDSYYSKANIGGRIDLPRASERWKLIFESENTEQNSLADQRLNNVTSSEFTGGFRYEFPEWNGWRFNNDLGVKSSIPLDPFYRFRARYGTDLNENWYLGFSNRIGFYHYDGFRQDTRLSFNREITSNVNFRVESELNYRHDARLTEFGQSFAFYQNLGEQATMSYQLGMIASNRPVSEVNNYYAQMVYRKAIYEDWLIMEIVPQLLFESRYNWKADPRVQLNLEVYFFNL
jgi:hypothetical protein